MQKKYYSLTPPDSSGPLRKLAALITTAALVVLVLMFSALLLVVIAVVATLAWAYLWWKTRELRKQMRDSFAQNTVREEKASADGVFEGEVIRVVDTGEGR